MSEYSVLKNAPITEALLDIRAVLPPETDLERLAAIQEPVRDRFPLRQERSLLEVHLESKEGGETAVSQAGGVDGYLFLSPEPDPTKVFQARIDGFSFSKLKPYQSWDAFRNEARELWNLYIAVAHPITVSRLGLRFINRIELPTTVREFSDYILTLPEIPQGIPPHVSEFFMRLVMPQPESEAKAIVTVATNLQEMNDRVLPLILDIDVFEEVQYEPHAEAIWHTFEHFRAIKNKIFFSSITKATKELFR